MNDQRDTILIVDDMEVNRVILSGAFEKSYNLLEAENGEQAMLLIGQYHSRIAAILLDVIMPVKDGYQVMSEINAHGWLAEFPVIVITAEDSAESEMRAFDMGASDIIVKPFELHVVRRRVQNIIELNQHKLYQDELIEEQAKKLRESNAVMIDALSSIIEYRSVETGKHIQRIGAFTKVLLEDVAKCYPEYLLDDRQIAIIVSASALHDIGKIAIPDAILNKPGRLTPEEYEIMKTHSVKGCEMLAGLDRMGDREYLQYAYNICRYHHERWDGRGYPDGLKGDNIPICSQVVGIADCYDALTNDRVYKKALPPEQAINMILNGECGTFSPRLLEILKNVQDTLMLLSTEYSDAAETPAWENRPETAGTDLPKNDTLDTLQLGQMKYFTLLKYIDATVMEVDFSTGLYHLVYLSGDDFSLLKSGSSFRESLNNFAARAVHPDDREMVLQFTDEYVDTLFDEGLMKRTRRYRVYSNKLSGYCWCEATIMRIDLDSPRQRKVLIAWREEDNCAVNTRQQRKQLDESLLQNIIEGVQVFHNDKWYTMDEPCEGICKLVGYSAEELRDKFKNHYLELIYPPDREDVARQIREQTRTGKLIELEYRLVTKEGEPIWVLDKSRIFTAEDGCEYFSSILINVTQTRRIQDELHFLTERYQIIMDQTNDIICEWDAKKDQLTYSSNWVKKFGYEPIRDQASKRIQNASHIHPEDMPLFNHLISDIRGGMPYEEMDIRFADQTGHYRWCKIRIAAQFDGVGELYKAVGVITDIDADKRASQELRSKAERDSLTMLYNRRTASQKIEEIIRQSEEGERAAMLIVDVDDFKFINDVYGHMFGDVVLQEIASELQKIFRSGDVIARVGGDEFLIFMRGIRDESIVRERADKINETFRTVLSQNMEGKTPSCCVGISFYPENGTNYDELFRHSDVALYNAKARGKRNYEIYDQTMERSFGSVPSAAANTEIDSESVQEGAQQVSIIDRVFRVLYETDDTNSAINGILEMAGREFCVSRAYIFEDDGNGYSQSNTFEWCNEGITAEIAGLKQIPYVQDDADYRDLFSESDIFYCPDISALPEWEEQILNEQNIQSMLQCAIRENGKFKGFVGFDDCVIRRIWTKNQIDTLSMIAHLLSSFLLKRRAQDRFESTAANIAAVLDAQSDWVLVIDPSDYRILYRNRAVLETPLRSETGMHCYEVRGLTACPCADCPMEKLTDEPQYVEEPLPNGNRFSCVAQSIQWDGRRVCLLTGRLKGNEI